MNSFEITLTGTYIRNEIPPRCRKARAVLKEATTKVHVPQVTSADAPLAFRIRMLDGEYNEVRAYNGRLFAPYKPFARQTELTTPGSIQFPQELDRTQNHQFSNGASEEEFTRGAEEFYARYLIIDGIVWAETAEPAYLVTTFGLGGINGSTALMPSSRKDHGTLFRADEFDAARAYARKISANRGDPTEKYDPENAETYRVIEVLIPEEVTLVTVPPTPDYIRDLRSEYGHACDRLARAETPDEDTFNFGEVVRLREQIIKEGHAPIDPNLRPYEARKKTTPEEA